MISVLLLGASITGCTNTWEKVEENALIDMYLNYQNFTESLRVLKKNVYTNKEQGALMDKKKCIELVNTYNLAIGRHYDKFIKRNIKVARKLDANKCAI